MAATVTTIQSVEDTGTFTGDVKIGNLDGTLVVSQATQGLIDISAKVSLDALLSAIKAAAATTSYATFQTAMAAIPLP